MSLPAALAVDLYQGNRIFSLGSWGMMSTLGFFVLSLPSLVKTGNNKFQEWIFQRLKLAIDAKDLKSFQYLLGFLQDANRRDENGDALLHFLLRQKKVDIKWVQLLKKRGADPFAKNKKEEMAVFYQNTNVPCLQALLDCNHPDFAKCKNREEFFKLLFPSQEELPLNWRKIIKKYKETDALLQFEREAPELFEAQKNLLSFDQIVSKIKKRKFTIIKFMWTVIKQCPLYRRLYLLCGPTILEKNLAFLEHCKLFPRGVGGYYAPKPHLITISKNGSPSVKFLILIFETFNSLQRENCLRIHHLLESGEIHGEENAILREWTENISWNWSVKVLRALKNESLKETKFTRHWKISNSAPIGFSSHANFFRDSWRNSLLPFVYLSKHPEYIKNRLAEMSQ